MVLVGNDNNAFISYYLNLARHQLLDNNIPLQIRATAYIRICCSIARKCHYSTPNSEPGHKKQSVQISYLDVLKWLSDQDSQWWNTCYVNPEGLLESDNPDINERLKPQYLLKPTEFLPPSCPLKGDTRNPET